MPEIVRVGVDHASTWVGFDQYLFALAGLSKESAIAISVMRDTDMAPCHSRIDPIGVGPICRDIALPVAGFEFHRPERPGHSLRPLGRFRMLSLCKTQQYRQRDADPDRSKETLDRNGQHGSV